jgi:hypothetical protein
MIYKTIFSIILLAILSVSNQPLVAGEKISQAYTSSSPEDLILVQKIVTPVQTGKGLGNMLRVWVEVAARDEIERMEINEIVDDSLQITKLDLSNIEPIHFLKLASPREIGFLRLALIRGDPILIDTIYGSDIIGSNIYKNDIKAEYDQFQISLSNLPTHSNISENGQDINYILNILKYNFECPWANPNECNFYLHQQNSSYLVDIISNSDPGNWARLEIENLNENYGMANLTLSDNRNYALQFITNTGGEKQLSDQAGILRLYVSHLSPRERLFYWYYVKPKRSGTLETESMISIYYKGVREPDISYPLQIKVGKPDMNFEVSPILEKSRIYAAGGLWGSIFHDLLNLRYEISYKGNASSQYTQRIKIELEEPEGGHFSNIKGTPEPTRIYLLDFSSNRKIAINTNILYNNTGIFQIPGIWIEGKRYESNMMVTIDDPLSRNRDLIFAYLASIIGFLLTIVFREDLAEKIRSVLKYIKMRLLGKKDQSQEKEYALQEYIQ